MRAIINKLDVSIPRLRTRWRHAQRADGVVRAYEVKRLLYRLTEFLLLQYQVITRRHYDISLHFIALPVLVVRIQSGTFQAYRTDMCRRICDTRRRVTSCRLAQHLLLLHVRYLLQDDLLVGYVRHDEHVLYRHQRTKSIHRHLQQTATRTKEVQKLLRLVLATVWPETAADAACHDHAIVVLLLVIHRYIVIRVQRYNFFFIYASVRVK